MGRTHVDSPKRVRQLRALEFSEAVWGPQDWPTVLGDSGQASTLTRMK